MFSRLLLLRQVCKWHLCRAVFQSQVVQSSQRLVPDLNIPTFRDSNNPSFISRSVTSLRGLRPSKKSTKKRKRVGRGHGGGRGITCGRGRGGQKSRSGREPGFMFDGGQKGLKKFPKYKVPLPRDQPIYTPLTLNRIASWLKQGRLDNSQVITMKDLRDSGCAPKRIKWGVKLLADVENILDRPVHLQVSACEDRAKRVVEAQGGSVTTVYYNDRGLRALLKPENIVRKGHLLPGPIRFMKPKLKDRFDQIGQIPPDKALKVAM